MSNVAQDRFIRWARPLEGLVEKEAAKAIIADRVRVDGGCWVWTRGTLKGYGILRVNGRNVRAHRLAFFAWRHDTRLDLDHLCRNRSCCNPDHLEPVTHAENVRRGERRQEVCKRGHDLSEARMDPDGERACRQCERIRRTMRRDADPERFRAMIRQKIARAKARKQNTPAAA